MLLPVNNFCSSLFHKAWCQLHTLTHKQTHNVHNPTPNPTKHQHHKHLHPCSSSPLRPHLCQLHMIVLCRDTIGLQTPNNDFWGTTWCWVRAFSRLVPQLCVTPDRGRERERWGRTPADRRPVWSLWLSAPHWLRQMHGWAEGRLYKWKLRSGESDRSRMRGRHGAARLYIDCQFGRFGLMFSPLACCVQHMSTQQGVSLDSYSNGQDIFSLEGIHNHNYFLTKTWSFGS